MDEYWRILQRGLVNMIRPPKLGSYPPWRWGDRDTIFIKFQRDDSQVLEKDIVRLKLAKRYEKIYISKGKENI